MYEALVRRFAKCPVTRIAQGTKDNQNEDFGESDGEAVHRAG